MRKLIAVLALAALLPGCATTYRDEFLKRAKAKGWTEEEQYAALYRSYRLHFAKEQEEGKFTVLYSRLPLKDVREQLDKRLEDLAYILDYKEEGWNQYLKTFNLRKHFEHEEEKAKARRARVRVAELDNTFLQLIGERSGYFGYGDSHDPREGYDPAILAETDMGKRFPFTSKTVEENRAKGVLQPVETFTISQSAKYDRKEPDPDYPNDPNKFIWRSKEFSLEVTKYKIVPEGEKPTDNYGNYLEAYRVVNGNKEKLPALKAFLDGKGGYAVIVVDSDFEKKTTGFGLPDFVGRVPERTVADSSTLDLLFPDDPANHRIEPKAPPIRLEIARIGETKESWDKATDSDVPTGYKAEPRYDNYNVRVKFKKIKNAAERAAHADPQGFAVEYIVREYTVPGNRYEAVKAAVVEYHHPKAPYNGKFLVARTVDSDNTKKLMFVGADGNEDTGYVTPLPNKYIGDKPFAISYKLGEKWFWLQDDDGDGKYEKKKEIGPPRDKTGVYRDELAELRAGAAGHDHGGGDYEGDLPKKKPEADKP